MSWGGSDKSLKLQKGQRLHRGKGRLSGPTPTTYPRRGLLIVEEAQKALL